MEFTGTKSFIFVFTIGPFDVLLSSCHWYVAYIRSYLTVLHIGCENQSIRCFLRGPASVFNFNCGLYPRDRKNPFGGVIPEKTDRSPI